MNEPCVFCLILAGEIPSINVYEDDATLAFMDIHPVHPGHTLVIPKAHHANLFEIPGDVIAATARTVAKVGRAIQEVVQPPGMNVLQCNGEAAEQSVQHFHMHLIPREMGDGMTMNWELVKGDVDQIQALAERIRDRIV